MFCSSAPQHVGRQSWECNHQAYNYRVAHSPNSASAARPLFVPGRTITCRKHKIIHHLWIFFTGQCSYDFTHTDAKCIFNLVMWYLTLCIKNTTLQIVYEIITLLSGLLLDVNILQVALSCVCAEDQNKTLMKTLNNGHNIIKSWYNQNLNSYKTKQRSQWRFPRSILLSRWTWQIVLRWILGRIIQLKLYVSIRSKNQEHLCYETLKSLHSAQGFTVTSEHEPHSPSISVQAMKKDDFHLAEPTAPQLCFAPSIPPTLRPYPYISSFCNGRVWWWWWWLSLGRHSHPKNEKRSKNDQWETIRHRLRVRDRQTIVWWCENQSARLWAICNLERGQNSK